MTTILSSPTTITVANPGTSALATLAASMQRGTWRQLNASGLTHFVGGPTSGVRTGYSDKMAYDHLGKRIYWIGCDHNQAQVFLQYDEMTNAWTVLPQTPFASPTKHGYNHTTWDTKHGVLYHVPFGERATRRWNGGSSWTTISWTGVLDYTGGAIGHEWFPDLGPNGHLMVFSIESGTNGRLIGYDPVEVGGPRSQAATHWLARVATTTSRCTVRSIGSSGSAAETVAARCGASMRVAMLPRAPTFQAP